MRSHARPLESVPTDRLCAASRRRQGLLRTPLPAVAARRSPEAPVQDLPRGGLPQAEHRAWPLRGALSPRLPGSPERSGRGRGRRPTLTWARRCG